MLDANNSPLEKISHNIDEDDDDDDDTPINPFEMPNKLYKKLIWIILLPINILYFFTVPDCRRKLFNPFPFYFLTFIMSTVYMGIKEYIYLFLFYYKNYLLYLILIRCFNLFTCMDGLYYKCIDSNSRHCTI